MNKVLLLTLFVLLGLSSTAVNAQSYLNSPWTLKNMTEIRNTIGSILGNEFYEGKITFSEDRATASVIFAKKDTDLVTAVFTMSVINASSENQTKGQKVIGGYYSIKGPFMDMVHIFQKLFDPTVDPYPLKKNGYSQMITKTEGNTEYNAILLKTNNEYWNLTVREIK